MTGPPAAPKIANPAVEGARQAASRRLDSATDLSLHLPIRECFISLAAGSNPAPADLPVSRFCPWTRREAILDGRQPRKVTLGVPLILSSKDVFPESTWPNTATIGCLILKSYH